MKVLIDSDTHRRDDNFYKVLAMEKPIDLLIHAGDSEGTEDEMERAAGVPMRGVAGNNDFFSLCPSEDAFMLGPHFTFLTHGHRFYISTSEETLLEEAKAIQARIVIFGHTHRPVAREEDGVLLLNPGSLTYPRQIGRKPSYIILNVDDDGTLDYEIRYLEN